MDLPERPTQEELTAYFNGIKDKIRGKMVLIGKPAVIPVNIILPRKESATKMCKNRLDPNAPQQRPYQPPRASPEQTPKPESTRRAKHQ